MSNLVASDVVLFRLRGKLNGHLVSSKQVFFLPWSMQRLQCSLPHESAHGSQRQTIPLGYFLRGEVFKTINYYHTPIVSHLNEKCIQISQAIASCARVGYNAIRYDMIVTRGTQKAMDKEAERAYYKAWRERNQERCRATKKAWREAHKEQMQEYQAAYWEKRKEELRAYRKEWYEAHKEEQLARFKAYAETHKEEVKVYKKNYQKRHPERCRTVVRRRRERIKASSTGPIDYKAIQLRDKMICGICGERVEQDDLSFDHVIPIGVGGPHIEENIRVTHLQCNLKRGIGR